MKRILSFLKLDLKIKSSDTLVVSVSGGNDSMALLDMLRRLPYTLAVVHFNHQKRIESENDAKLVESYCKTHDLNYHYYALDIGGGNFHHIAHQLRTHYLKEVASIHHTPYILTAHHLDDLLENILIKLTRGSNLLGYAGMQQVHEKDGYVFVKPLLYVQKQELIAYVKTHQVPFLEDQSNEENVYLRNRYRHAIIPLMHQENDMLLETVKQYHIQLTNAFRYIRKQSIAFAQNLTIDVEAYKTLDPALKDDVIAYILESMQISFNMRIVEKIKSVLLSKRPNLSYPLGNNYTFIKSYETAYVKQQKDVADVKIELEIGHTKLDNMAIFTFFDKTQSITDHSVKLCYNKLAFPLWVRRRQDGDILSYNYGHKKLKKLLIDQKVPLEARKSILLVTDSDDTILWIPGYYLNQTLGSENELYFDLIKETSDA
jgi:bifunctional protein TilS/HprT